MKRLMIVLLGLFIIFGLAGLTFADDRGMMGGQGMMGPWATGGYAIFFGFYWVIKVIVVAIVLWLLFRITNALETIAKAKG